MESYAKHHYRKKIKNNAMRTLLLLTLSIHDNTSTMKSETE